MHTSWKEVLDSWETGDYLKYPAHMKDQFIWRTKVIDKNETIPFEQKFSYDKRLTKKQDYSCFTEHIDKSDNKYVVSFPNLTEDTILVIPIPKDGKIFTYVKDFMDNASVIQQQEVWRKVAQVVREQLKTHDYVWLSSTNLDVPYLHIRIGLTPKYFRDSPLQYIPDGYKIPSLKLSGKTNYKNCRYLTSMIYDKVDLSNGKMDGRCKRDLLRIKCHTLDLSNCGINDRLCFDLKNIECNTLILSKNRIYKKINFPNVRKVVY